MGGLLLLLALCVVMAVASFLAGALPLSMTLSNSHMRLLSSVGVGILVGTSMIIIIPEGIEAAASRGSDEHGHSHRMRTVARRTPWKFDIDYRGINTAVPSVSVAESKRSLLDDEGSIPEHISISLSKGAELARRQDELSDSPLEHTGDEEEHEHGGHDDEGDSEHHDDEHAEFPSLEIGLSMVLGFILMFLIDRLPRHAADSMQPNVPQMRHISLENLTGSGGTDTSSVDEEAEGFLGSLTPTPRRARSLATTIGLVIHAAADGIAMGASSTSSDMKLGFIIFIAIMIHKAPAAFGLTSVLLKQGLSKRAARGHLIVFSLAAPFGAIATWLLITLLGGGDMDGDTQQWWTGMLLLFSGGTFLYVAMHAMQEDANGHAHDHGPGSNGYSDSNSQAQRKPKGPQMRDSLATVGGMLLPLLTQFGHHHH